jgi:hypothetical protein
MMNLFAGYKTQIRVLERKLKELDHTKLNPAKVNEITEAIKSLKELVKEKEQKREERRKGKEQKASEVEKEADSSTTLTTTSPAAPGAATSPTTTTTPAATPDDQKVSCPLCGGMTFPDNAAYQQHMAYTHASDVMPTTPGQKEDKLVASVETEAAPNCAICGVTFKSFPEYKAHREDAHGQRDYTPMDPAKKQEVVKNVEKNLGPAIISEQEGPQFKLDDVVKPIRGSESTGKVMRWDGKPSDLVFVAWESGPLAERDGFGGYYPKDLELFQEEPVAVEADGNGEPPHNAGPEHICPDCKDWHEKHADLKGNYAALLKDLKEEREIHYTQGNSAWVARLDQKIQDLEKSIGEKFPKEAACPTCGSVKEGGAENAKDLTLLDHTPPRANSGPDAGGKDSHDEMQDEWAMPAGIEMESKRGTPGTLYNAETAQSVSDRIKTEVNAPYVNSSISTLGGPENVGIYFTIAVEPREAWSNGILENSRYGKFVIYNDGELECHSGEFHHYNEPRMMFRKRNVKSVDQLIQVLNSWVAQVQAAYASAPKTSALSAPITEPTKISVFKKEFLATPITGQKKFGGYDISQNGKKLFNIGSKDSQPMTKEQLEFCAQIELTRGLKQAKLVEKIAFLDEGTRVYIIATDKSGKRVKFASLDQGVRGWVPSSKIKLLALESQTVRHGEHSDKVLGQTATETLLDCIEGGPVWVGSAELLGANRPPATPEALNPIEEEASEKGRKPSLVHEEEDAATRLQEEMDYKDELESLKKKESAKDCPDCHGQFIGAEGDKCPTCGRFSVKEAARECKHHWIYDNISKEDVCDKCNVSRSKPENKEALKTALPSTIPNQRGYLDNPPPVEKKADETEVLSAEGLDMYANNTSELYPAKLQIIEEMKEMLRTRMYDQKDVIKSWHNWFVDAATKYMQEFPEAAQPNIKTVRQAAAEMELHIKQQIEQGEYTDPNSAEESINKLPTMDVEQAKDDLLNQLAKETDPERKKSLEQKYKRLSMNSSLNKKAGPYCASHVTWDREYGYQCLNCGAKAEHSWELKHDPKKNPQLRASVKEAVAQHFTCEKCGEIWANTEPDLMKMHCPKCGERDTIKRASLNKIAHIRHENGKWVVYSHDYSKTLGSYPTKAEAVHRLKSIEYWKSHKGTKVRPFSKKAEVMTDPYQALTEHITDMRTRMEQVQQRLETAPLPKQAGADEKDNSSIELSTLFEDLAMGVDLIESKAKDEMTPELHENLESLENLLWEAEMKLGLTPKLSEHEKEEPEHKEVVEEVKEMDKEAAYDEKWLEKIDCADCRAVSSGHDRRHYCEKHEDPRYTGVPKGYYPEEKEAAANEWPLCSVDGCNNKSDSVVEGKRYCYTHSWGKGGKHTEAALPTAIAPTLSNPAPAATTPAVTPDDKKTSCALCGGMQFNDFDAYQQHMEYTHASDTMPTSPTQKNLPTVAASKKVVADTVTDETIVTNDPNAVLPDSNAPAAPVIQNVQPTDQDNLEVPVVKPSSPPAPGQIWVYNPDAKAYVSMPNPETPGKTI